MGPVEASKTLLEVTEGQLVLLVSLASMLIGGFAYVAKQLVGLTKLLDQKLNLDQYERKHSELQRLMEAKIDDMGKRVRLIELWAAKKNNPEFN
jgi:hypothetical protein